MAELVRTSCRLVLCSDVTGRTGELEELVPERADCCSRRFVTVSCLGEDLPRSLWSSMPQERLLRHGDQAIIAISLPFLLLLRFDGSNQRAFDQAAWKEWLIGEKENVQRIFLITFESLNFGLEGSYLILFLLPFGSLDDDLAAVGDVRGIHSRSCSGFAF